MSEQHDERLIHLTYVESYKFIKKKATRNPAGQKK